MLQVLHILESFDIGALEHGLIGIGLKLAGVVFARRAGRDGAHGPDI